MKSPEIEKILPHRMYLLSDRTLYKDEDRSHQHGYSP
jgi:hypothetical protein